VNQDGRVRQFANSDAEPTDLPDFLTRKVHVPVDRWQPRYLSGLIKASARRREAEDAA
jgi:hypothetical protein